MNIIFGTVYYHSARSYVKDFINSLLKQTNSNFTLLVINDSSEDIKKVFKLLSNVVIIKNPLKSHTSIPALRALLIRESYKLKADILILGDIDDYFSSNRVQMNASRIKQYDFLFNDVILVNKARSVVSHDFLNKPLKRSIKSNRMIMDKNMLGLSNTSLNLKKLNLGKISIPDNLVAVDWWLFTKLLLNNKKGAFLKNVYTYYRQYENNLIGGSSVLNERTLNTGLEAKIRHYEYFAKKGFNNYSQRLKQMLELKNYLKKNDQRKKYISSVNRKFRTQNPVWWENIITLKEAGKYGKDC